MALAHSNHIPETAESADPAPIFTVDLVVTGLVMVPIAQTAQL